MSAARESTEFLTFYVCLVADGNGGANLNSSLFSGSGSVQRTTVSEKDEEPTKTDSTAYPSGYFVATQGMVLHELQH